MEKALQKVSPSTFGHMPINGTAPQFWCQWGNSIVIEPLPDAVYVLSIFVSDFPVTELTAVTDYPSSLPDEFHPCIVDFALYIFSVKMKKWQQAAKYYNIYVRNLSTRKREYAMNHPDGRFAHELPENVTMEAQGGR